VEAIASVSASAWQTMPALLARIESAEQICADDQDLMVSLNMSRLMAELPPPEVSLS
jgi:hypothetical protein